LLLSLLRSVWAILAVNQGFELFAQGQCFFVQAGLAAFRVVFFQLLLARRKLASVSLSRVSLMSPGEWSLL